MSAPENKSDDKKDIEMEEREKIKNAENIAQDVNPKDGKVNITEKEGREVKPKKIPIGGIQMPGFFTRSRSKEKCKDSESEQGGNDAEGAELLESAKEQTNLEEKPQRIKLPNPFGKKVKSADSGDADKPHDPQQRKSLIDTIRIPLVSVFPRKSKQDQSLVSQTGAAGLASMETLDDTDKSADHKNEDDLKNVKLDDDKTDLEKQNTLEEPSWRARVRAYRVVISALLIFILILIVIVVLIIPGRQSYSLSLKNGRFVETATSCGPVEGKLEDGAFAFRGIPYAIPPTGENRWKAAQPLDRIEYCWNGTLLAHNATDVCSQLYADGKIGGIEDCLTLDVVTPYVRYDTPLPVVVMIGGESMMGGSPAKMRPSSRYARSRDVLFVRPNFRLGALGFLALETLSKATHPPSSGNYALSDIMLALKWVQLNIEHFGGDPKAVTLFGHRAGATLVTALSSTKHAKKLFARAWATSGGALYPGKHLPESEQANLAYLETMTCKDVDCLRSQSVETVIQAVPDTWRKPPQDLPSQEEIDVNRHEWLVLDGNIMKYHPAEIWANEDDSPVKLVLGTTAHAAASDYLSLRHKTWTPDLVRAHINDSLLGKLNLTDEVFKMYPATFQGLVSLVSDIRIVCPLLAIATQQRAVPLYVVTQTRYEQNLADIDSDVDAILGRYEPHSPEQRRYVASMQLLFYHYVWHGEVLQTENIRDKVLVIEQDILPAANYTHCDFWINKDIVPKYAQLD